MTRISTSDLLSGYFARLNTSRWTAFGRLQLDDVVLGVELAGGGDDGDGGGAESAPVEHGQGSDSQ